MRKFRCIRRIQRISILILKLVGWEHAIQESITQIAQNHIIQQQVYRIPETQWTLHPEIKALLKTLSTTD